MNPDLKFAAEQIARITTASIESIERMYSGVPRGQQVSVPSQVPSQVPSHASEPDPHFHDSIPDQTNPLIFKSEEPSAEVIIKPSMSIPTRASRPNKIDNSLQGMLL